MKQEPNISPGLNVHDWVSFGQRLTILDILFPISMLKQKHQLVYRRVNTPLIYQDATPVQYLEEQSVRLCLTYNKWSFTAVPNTRP